MPIVRLNPILDELRPALGGEKLFIAPVGADQVEQAEELVGVLLPLAGYQSLLLVVLVKQLDHLVETADLVG